MDLQKTENKNSAHYTHLNSKCMHCIFNTKKKLILNKSNNKLKYIANDKIDEKLKQEAD